MTKLVLRLPLTPRGLSANGREDWRKFAEIKKQYKLETQVMLDQARQQAKWVALPRARISLHFCTKGARPAGLYAPRDWDNAVAVFKSAQDALVLAGVLIGDSSDVLEGGRVSFDRKAGPWIEVTIEDLPP